MLLKRALFIGVMSCCGIAAFAQTQPQGPQQTIYKWTDEHGKIQYSELPPSVGVPFETVRKPGAQGKESGRDLAKDQEELARQLAEQKQKEQQQTEKAQQEAADIRTKNCEIAKKNIEILESGKPVLVPDAKGNKVPLDAEQRAAELQKAKKDMVVYNCNP